MKMKWLFFFAAAYAILIANAPKKCDVQSLHQCTKEEIALVHTLKQKSKEELLLLIEMEHAEVELVRQRYIERLSYIINEINTMEKEIEVLNSLYSKHTLTFEKSMLHIREEYKSDLIRRILASEQDRNADGPIQSEMLNI